MVKGRWGFATVVIFPTCEKTTTVAYPHHLSPTTNGRGRTAGRSPEVRHRSRKASRSDHARRRRNKQTASNAPHKHRAAAGQRTGRRPHTAPGTAQRTGSGQAAD
ncbi:hypothetical protein GCM10017688_24560 [Streptomyces ramulosus]